MMDINTICDVAEETDSWIPQDFIEDADNRFDGLVIRRNTITYQSERRGEAVEDVNGQYNVAFLKKRFGGIQSGRARANNGNA